MHRSDPRRFAFGPVAVGHAQDAAVGQQFDARIRAVPAVVVVHQPHAAPTFGALHDVLPRPNPRHPVALGDRLAGGVAEANHQVSVLVVPRGVAIAGQGGGQWLGIGPGATGVGAEDHRAVVLA